jgi:hypothetical protein
VPFSAKIKCQKCQIHSLVPLSVPFSAMDRGNRIGPELARTADLWGEM